MNESKGLEILPRSETPQSVETTEREIGAVAVKEAPTAPAEKKEIVEDSEAQEIRELRKYYAGAGIDERLFENPASREILKEAMEDGCITPETRGDFEEDYRKMPKSEERTYYEKLVDGVRKYMARPDVSHPYIKGRSDGAVEIGEIFAKDTRFGADFSDTLLRGPYRRLSALPGGFLAVFGFEYYPNLSERAWPASFLHYDPNGEPMDPAEAEKIIEDLSTTGIPFDMLNEILKQKKDPVDRLAYKKVVQEYGADNIAGDSVITSNGEIISLQEALNNAKKELKRTVRDRNNFGAELLKEAEQDLAICVKRLAFMAPLQMWSGEADIADDVIDIAHLKSGKQFASYARQNPVLRQVINKYFPDFNEIKQMSITEDGEGVFADIDEEKVFIHSADSNRAILTYLNEDEGYYEAYEFGLDDDGEMVINERTIYRIESGTKLSTKDLVSDPEDPRLQIVRLENQYRGFNEYFVTPRGEVYRNRQAAQKGHERVKKAYAASLQDRQKKNPGGFYAGKGIPVKKKRKEANRENSEGVEEKEKEANEEEMSRFRRVVERILSRK